MSVRLAELWEMWLGYGKQRGALWRNSASATGCDEDVPHVGEALAPVCVAPAPGLLLSTMLELHF